MSGSSTHKPRAVLAVDLPNINQQLAVVFGDDFRVDWDALRQDCRREAARRLNLESHDFDFRSCVFMQGIHTDPALAATDRLQRRNQFVRYLTSIGWATFQKDAQKPTPQLSHFVHELGQQLHLPGRRQVELLRMGEPEIDELDLLAREMLGVFPEFTTTAQRLKIRLYVSLIKSSWARHRLHQLLLEAYEKLVDLEASQRDVRLRVLIGEIRASEAARQVPDFRWQDLSQLDRHGVTKLAYRLFKALQKVDTVEKQMRDIDNDLNSWVADQMLPLRQTEPYLPGVVFLVGNDFKNHLRFVVPRVKRNPQVQVVFLVLQDKYEQAKPETRSQLDQYEVVFIDKYVKRAELCVA